MRHLFLKHFLIHHLLTSQSRLQSMFHLEFPGSSEKLAMRLLLFLHGVFCTRVLPRSAAHTHLSEAREILPT